MRIAKSEVQRAKEKAGELMEYPGDVSENAKAILVGLVYLAHSVKEPINALGPIVGIIEDFLGEDEDVEEEEDIPF